MNLDEQEAQDDFKSLIDLLVSSESFGFEFWIARIDQSEHAEVLLAQRDLQDAKIVFIETKEQQ